MSIKSMIKIVEVVHSEVKLIRKTNTSDKLRHVEGAAKLLLENLKRADRPGMNR